MTSDDPASPLDTETMRRQFERLACLYDDQALAALFDSSCLTI